MPLIAFDGMAAPRVDKPVLSFGKRGSLNLNIVAATYLRVPCRVDIYYDSDSKRIVFKRNVEGKVKIEGTNQGKSGRVFNKTLLEWLKEFGVDITPNKRYVGEIREEEEALIFNVA